MAAHESGWKWWHTCSFLPDFHRLHWHQLAWRTLFSFALLRGWVYEDNQIKELRFLFSFGKVLTEFLSLKPGSFLLRFSVDRLC